MNQGLRSSCIHVAVDPATKSKDTTIICRGAVSKMRLKTTEIDLVMILSLSAPYLLLVGINKWELSET